MTAYRMGGISPPVIFFRAVGDKRYCKFNVVLFGDGRKFPQKMQKNDETRRKRLTNVKIIAKIHA